MTSTEADGRPALERFNAMLDSPAVSHLRGRVLAMDVAAGTCETDFDPLPEFLNPFGQVQGGPGPGWARSRVGQVQGGPGPGWARSRVGQVQGGFVTAMLDSVCGIAGIAASDLTRFMPTLEIKTSFIRPTWLGRLVGHGRCLRLGRSIAFLEGGLFDMEGRELARSTVTARPIPIEKAFG